MGATMISVTHPFRKVREKDAGPRFASGHRFTGCGKSPASYQGIASAMPKLHVLDAPLGAKVGTHTFSVDKPNRR